ncbi:methyltransferase domain-containing protein [uncultured Anaeromusa sp.]|uniref:methyltransferase domain-containing protein n=1 Tax=uncultured Anaeromusa sp. TaxID=673273 RepID=UPI0029C96B79|nr:methyltransferase domain-containing protein [uncultured Anaeromusa sp.]
MNHWKEFFIEKNYQKAYEILVQSVVEDKKNSEILLALTQCCSQLGKFSEAESYALQVMEIEPTLDNLYNIISIKYKLALYGEVIHLGLQFIQHEPKNFAIWDMLGDSFFQEQKYDDAVKCYQYAGEITEKEKMTEKAKMAEAYFSQNTENRRLEAWADEFYTYSKYGEAGRKRTTISLTGLFKDQVLEYKLVEKLLANHKGHLNQIDVLDVGCGEGRWLRKLVDWGADPSKLCGVDINQDIIELARSLSAPGIHFEKAMADKLPYADGSFDLVILIGVLQHILDPELQKAIGMELLRVLKSEGVILTYNYSKSGWDTTDINTQMRIKAMGVDEENLKNFFGECQIEYEEMLTSDSIITNMIPEQWGMIYDLARDPYSINHGFALASIRKA